MDVISYAQWTRIVLYALIGILAYLNSVVYKGIARVHRQTMGLIAFALAGAVMCSATLPEWSPVFNAIVLTPLIAFFLVVEVIVFINRRRNNRPHRRMGD